METADNRVMNCHHPHRAIRQRATELFELLKPHEGSMARGVRGPASWGTRRGAAVRPRLKGQHTRTGAGGRNQGTHQPGPQQTRSSHRMNYARGKEVYPK